MRIVVGERTRLVEDLPSLLKKELILDHRSPLSRSGSLGAHITDLMGEAIRMNL